MNAVLRFIGSVIFLILLLNKPVKSGEKEFPYSLKKADIAIAPASIFLYYGNGLFFKNPVKPLNANEILALDPMQVNWFDRPATRQWSPDAARSSDFTRTILVYSPVALILPELGKGKIDNLLTLGVMYIEAIEICGGINSITKSWAGRKRPFLYNTSLTEEYRISAGSGREAYRSFFSAHTSGAFCSAVFLSKTLTDIYGKTPLSYAVWGTSLTLAGVTGYLRYKAGMHYPTDIIAGAIAGSAIGYLIPLLHKKNKDSALQIAAFFPNGISATLTF